MRERDTSTDDLIVFFKNTQVHPDIVRDDPLLLVWFGFCDISATNNYRVRWECYSLFINIS